MREKKIETMKGAFAHTLYILFFVLLVFSLTFGECVAAEAEKGLVTLEVLNPQGEVPVVEETAPSPRLDTLDGKTIAMISNGHPDVNVVLEEIEQNIKEKYPTANFVHMRTGSGYNLTEEQINEIKGYDAYVHGIGD